MNIEFNKNEDAMKMSLSMMEKRFMKAAGKSRFKNKEKKINSRREKELIISLTMTNLFWRSARLQVMKCMNSKVVVLQGVQLQVLVM
jgi:hypothetical protein